MGGGRSPRLVAAQAQIAIRAVAHSKAHCWLNLAIDMVKPPRQLAGNAGLRVLIGSGFKDDTVYRVDQQAGFVVS